MNNPILTTISIFVLFHLYLVIYAQDNVGIGTLTPNAKAILDLEATDKGFLAPRLSTANRLNIAPAATEAGLLVFDTDLNIYFYWEGTQWVSFPGSSGFNTSLTFDNQTNTLSITDGGGTLSVNLAPLANTISITGEFCRSGSTPGNATQTFNLSTELGVALNSTNAFCALTRDGGGNNGSGEYYHVYLSSGSWFFNYRSAQNGLHVCVRCVRFAP